MARQGTSVTRTANLRTMLIVGPRLAHGTALLAGRTASAPSMTLIDAPNLVALHQQLPVYSLLSKSAADEALDTAMSLFPILIVVPFLLFVAFNAVKGILGSFGKGNFDQ